MVIHCRADLKSQCWPNHYLTLATIRFFDIAEPMLQTCSGYAVLLGKNSSILNIHDIRIPRIWKNVIILPLRLEYGIARWLAYIPETSEAGLVLDYDTIPAETGWIVASSADGFRLGSVAVSPISNSREYGISRIPFALERLP